MQMRASNDLNRLSAAQPATLADTESLVGAKEEDRILERILSSGRAAPVPHSRRRAMLALAAAGIAATAVALAATGGFDRAHPSVAKSAVRPHAALTGQMIALAGYHFRTPAGYTSSDSCPEPATSRPGSPSTVINSMKAAASAAGGCLQVALIAGASAVPPGVQTSPGAQAVAVGAYSGVVASRTSGVVLYVKIPAADGDHYLVLVGQGLTADQLIAIAESGLPTSVPPTQTCTTNCG
jgi:hypothetical protein